MERLLARLKAAWPDRTPSIERFVGGGYLSQVLSAHLVAGGADPRVITRDELLKDGVPLRAGRGCVETARSLPPVLAYANSKLAAEKRLRLTRGEPAISKEEGATARSRFIEEFPRDFSGGGLSISGNVADDPPPCDPRVPTEKNVGLFSMNTKSLPIHMHRLSEVLLQ